LMQNEESLVVLDFVIWMSTHIPYNKTFDCPLSCVCAIQINTPFQGQSH
jgi:hypothetical protein